MKDLYNLKVASVEGPIRVVLNAGSDDGVRHNMTFVLFSVGDEILDPDTGESLGGLEKVKGTVEVIHVQEKMCIAESASFVTRKVPVRSHAITLGVAIGGERQYDEIEVKKQLSDVVVGDRARRTS